MNVIPTGASAGGGGAATAYRGRQGGVVRRLGVSGVLDGYAEPDGVEFPFDSNRGRPVGEEQGSLGDGDGGRLGAEVVEELFVAVTVRQHGVILVSRTVRLVILSKLDKRGFVMMMIEPHWEVSRVCMYAKYLCPSVEHGSQASDTLVPDRPRTLHRPVDELGET